MIPRRPPRRRKDRHYLDVPGLRLECKRNACVGALQRRSYRSRASTPRTFSPPDGSSRAYLPRQDTPNRPAWAPAIGEARRALAQACISTHPGCAAGARPVPCSHQSPIEFNHRGLGGASGHAGRGEFFSGTRNEIVSTRPRRSHSQRALLRGCGGRSAKNSRYSSNLISSFPHPQRRTLLGRVGRRSRDVEKAAVCRTHHTILVQNVRPQRERLLTREMH